MNEEEIIDEYNLLHKEEETLNSIINQEILNKLRKENIENSANKLREEIYSLIIQKRTSDATELINEFIKKHFYIKTTKQDKNNEVWYYDEGIYIPNGECLIREVCRMILKENYKVHFINEIIEKVKVDTLINMEQFFNNKYREEIPVMNGILNIRDRKLTPYTHEKYFFNKINAYYNPKAECKKIHKFFESIFNTEEDIKLIYEIIGYCLLKDNTHEVSFMFHGGGRNGKSKTLELMKHFLNEINCSSVPLNQLVPNSFSVAKLFSKLVNLAGDIGNDDLKDSSLFKQLTGRDLITAKRKFLSDLEFNNTCKLVFACNDLPRVYDFSKGFWSRWILITFPNTFVSEELLNEDKNNRLINPYIIDELINIDEFSGLLNEALSGLDRIINRNSFSYSKDSKEVKDLWIKKSDSFTAFCLEFLDEESDSYVTKKELRNRFSKFCRSNKVKGCSDYHIKQILQEMFGVEDARKSIEVDFDEQYKRPIKDVINVWDGVKWKNRL